VREDLERRLQRLVRMRSRNCYICQFHGSLVPKTHNPVRLGSVNATVGTCHLCSVWACAWHGHLYGVFECAKCTPGAAIADAMTDVSVVGAEAVVASTYFRDGLNGYASEVVGEALRRILTAHPEPVDRRLPIDPGNDEPNLITNLAGVIYRHLSRTARPELPANVTETEIAAVGAAVRSTFVNRMFRAEHDEDSRRVLAAALQMAYELAGEHFPERSDSSRELFMRWKPPWRVAQPLLLHPTVWLLATACELVLNGAPDE
jgi:hypothetical protein